MDLGVAADKINSAFAAKKTVGKAARDQGLPFMFEVSGGDVVTPDRFILPLNPESLRVTWSTRTKITHTKAGAFQDNIGLGLPHFSLQGTFGYRGTLDNGNAARSLTGDKKSALELFRDMETILLLFYSRFGTYKLSGVPTPNPVDPANPPLLNFYNFTDRDFYVVQLDKFELLRNTQRKFLYQYDIQMTGLKRVSAPMSEDKLATLLGKLDGIDNTPQWLKFIQDALKLYSAVSNAIASVLNTIDNIKKKIDQVVAAVKAFRNGLTKLIQAPFSLISSIVKGIQSIIKTLVSLKDIPHEIINAAREMARAIMPLQANEHLFVETSTGATTIPAPSIVSTEIITEPLPQNNPASQTFQMDTPEDTLFAPGTETVKEISVREAQITDNDTIYSIAQKNGVDWQQLASLNRLDYPFIAKSRLDLFTPALQVGGSASPITAKDSIIEVVNLTPAIGDILVFTEPGTTDLNVVFATVSNVNGDTVSLENEVEYDFSSSVVITLHEAILNVLRPGDKAQIPGSTQTTTPIISGSTNEDTYARLYGVDEQLDDTGAQNTDAGGDMQTVSGVANLQMQLRHRLMTLRGELAQVGHPEYGSLLPTMIGQLNVPVMQERALLEAELTILADPRIESLENGTFLTDGTALYFEADIYPIKQRNSTKISLPLAA
jgi:LysM repeat protein